MFALTASICGDVFIWSPDGKYCYLVESLEEAISWVEKINAIQETGE